MAKNQSTVFLGFLDEAITTKYQQTTDYTTNKLGGVANFPVPGVSVPSCPTCGLKRPLLLQVYAPLDNSPFHRTLFVFGCLSPSCSTQSQSWLCLRSQVLEKPREVREKQRGREEQMNINWCSGADDWGVEEEEGQSVPLSLDNDQFVTRTDEENGNIIMNDNYRQQLPGQGQDEDDDDESTSTSGGTELQLTTEQLNLMQIDEDNANCNGASAAPLDGAVGPLSAKNQASAEIEREETDDLVTIDTPESPHRDLIALLKQTPALRTDGSNSLTLQSYFLYVEEEPQEEAHRVSEHVRELLTEYQKKDEKSVNKTPDSPTGKDVGGAGDIESYEKAAPAHGDVLFHSFLMRIQENPGQILRYSRNSTPLLIAPLTERAEKCLNCGGELICELQLLPTLIPSLRLECNGEVVPMEFGNVLIYTCAKSCWDTPDKSRQEICVVQREV